MKKLICMLMMVMLLTAEVCVWAEEAETAAQWQNILFMGGDSRTTGGYARTDCMIIVSVNREEGMVKLTSIMRDTWLELPGTGITDRINTAAAIYGTPELAVETVNTYFGTDIEDYVMVNMSDLVRIVDMAGGIDLYVSESERKQTNNAAANFINSIRSYNGETKLEHSGYVHLNGLLAVAYTRNRTTDNDYGRVMRQQKMLIALAEAFQNMEVNDLMEVVGDIEACVVTSLESDEMKDLTMTGMAMDLEYIEQFRIPVDGTFESGMMDGYWKIVPDFEENAKLLNDFIYGENE